jgi:protease-4
VEPFIRDDMSPAAREADSRWIGELWQNYLGTVAANRQITPEQVFPGAQGVLEGLRKVDGDTAKYALDNKLVDALGTSAEIEKSLSKQFGWSKEDKNYSAISMYDYSTKNRMRTVTASRWSLLTVRSWTVRRPRGTWAAIPPRRKSAMRAWIRK